MSSLYKRSILIFLGAIAARVVFAVVTGYTDDSAFVIYRYAVNIAFGHGFVYNFHEHVLGTSTPLYCMLLSFFDVLRLAPPNASPFISMIASGLTAVVLYRFAHSLRFTRVAFLPALLYILWPRSLAADTSGLETALFGLLIISALYYQHKRKPFYSIALATLASLTRPEGLVLLLILLIHNFERDRYRRLRLLGVPVLLLIPWVLFSVFYFGSIVPNSLKATFFALGGGYHSLDILHRLVTILQLNNPAGWALLVAISGGVYWLHKKQNAGYLELVWLILSVAAIAILPDKRTLLLAASICPVYLLLASASIPFVLDRVHLSLGTMHKIILTGGLILAFILIGGCFVEFKTYGDLQDRFNQVNKEVGDYLYRHANRDVDWAAVDEVGYVGYYSELKLIDLRGGVSPQVLPYLRSGDLLDLIRDYKPQWVGLRVNSSIGSFTFDSRFLDDYELEKAFVFKGKPAYYLYTQKANGRRQQR